MSRSSFTVPMPKPGDGTRIFMMPDGRLRCSWDDPRMAQDAAPVDDGGQRSAELQQGLLNDVAKLQAKLEGDQEGLDLLDSLVSALLGPSEQDALSGETGMTARPVAEDQPPAFPSRPYRAGRGHDASFTPMRVAAGATDRGRRPIMATDDAAIQQIVARNAAKRAAKTTASIEAKFPGAH
jgi:hypothetical protein